MTNRPVLPELPKGYRWRFDDLTSGRYLLYVSKEHWYGSGWVAGDSFQLKPDDDFFDVLEARGVEAFKEFQAKMGTSLLVNEAKANIEQSPQGSPTEPQNPGRYEE